jgi:hypothetical protein
MKTLKNLIRFFPYESVHASDSLIIIEDKDAFWFVQINNFLMEYEADEYFGCAAGNFDLAMDNKITLELRPDYALGESALHDSIYLTYWDNKVFISTAYQPVSDVKYCTVKKK